MAATSCCAGWRSSATPSPTPSSPGLAIAFLFSGSLVVGGTVAGVVTAILVAVFSQNRRLREDSVIGIPDRDLYVVGGTGLILLLAVLLLHKEFVAVTLDREMARRTACAPSCSTSCCTCWSPSPS